MMCIRKRPRMCSSSRSAPSRGSIRPRRKTPRCSGACCSRRDIAQSLGVGESGFRIVINNGRDAGESVPHLHIHLLGGRPLAWPPG